MCGAGGRRERVGVVSVWSGRKIVTATDDRNVVNGTDTHHRRAPRFRFSVFARCLLFVAFVCQQQRSPTRLCECFTARRICYKPRTRLSYLVLTAFCSSSTFRSLLFPTFHFVPPSNQAASVSLSPVNNTSHQIGRHRVSHPPPFSPLLTRVTVFAASKTRGLRPVLWSAKYTAGAPSVSFGAVFTPSRCPRPRDPFSLSLSLGCFGVHCRLLRVHLRIVKPLHRN